MPRSRLPKGARILDRDETEAIYGMGSPNYMTDWKDVTTGMGNDTHGPGHDDDEGPCLGMARWKISEPYISLWLHDEPLGYQPSKGPRLSLLLNYVQRDQRADTNTFSVGKSWECSWLAYVSYQNGVGQVNETLYAPGGGVIYYARVSADNNFLARPSSASAPKRTGWNSSMIRAVTNSVEALSFQQVFPDGSQNIYDYRYTNLAGSGWAYLTQQIDAFGHTNRFEYDTTNEVILLRRVIDADGQTNTILYDSTLTYNVAAVIDPYGRSNRLAFDSSGLLTNSTDVASLSSSFKYEESGVVTNLHTPYGDTGFYFTRQTSNYWTGVTNELVRHSVPDTCLLRSLITGKS